MLVQTDRLSIDDKVELLEYATDKMMERVWDEDDFEMNFKPAYPHIVNLIHALLSNLIPLGKVPQDVIDDLPLNFSPTYNI